MIGLSSGMEAVAALIACSLAVEIQEVGCSSFQKCSHGSHACFASSSVPPYLGAPHISASLVTHSALLQLSMGRSSEEKLEDSSAKSEPTSVETPIVADSALNNTAVELFEQLRRGFEKTYSSFGRIPTNDLPPHDLTLDFEFETRAKLEMTPELLLARGSIDRERPGESSLLDTARGDGIDWPRTSKLFTVGLDGSGNKNDKGEWRQTLSAVVELESSLMSPREAAEGHLSRDVQTFLRRLQLEKNREGNVFPLPFDGSSSIRVNAKHLIDPERRCSRCLLHWTVGLPLQHVPKLLRMSADPLWQSVVANVDSRCSQKERGCPPEYHALISLAAAVLRKVQDSGCGHPKRGMKGWLLRTHFGDLAGRVREKLGPRALESVSEDVLAAGGFHGNESVLPNGVIDYLRLPEFAEVAGMVSSRSPVVDANRDSEAQKPAARDIPTVKDGLLSLSGQMLENYELVNRRLLSRGCHLHNWGSFVPRSFTVKDWLTGLQRGEDLMSDDDSEISKSSFSHLVWKSMGSWRMKPGTDRVYLECRRTKICLQGVKSRRSDPGPGGLIRIVGERMYQFEEELQQQPSS